MKNRDKRLAFSSCMLLASLGIAAAETPFTSFVSDDTVKVLRGSDAVIQVQPMHWGAGWKWVGLKPTRQTEDGVAVVDSKGTYNGAEVLYQARVGAAGAKRVTLDYTLSADRDTQTTLGILALTPGKTLVRKTVVVQKDGSTRTIEGDYAMQGLGKAVATATLFGDDGQLARLTFDPPIEIGSHGAARIILASGALPGNQPKRLKITVDVPGELTFFPATADVPFEPGFDAWYAWQPNYAYDQPSVLAMDDWLDKPAGRLGRIQRKGDALFTGDRSIRLWGLNLCYGSCVPTKEIADKRARFYARYGVNAVRLHKYAEYTDKGGVQSDDSFAEFNPESLDRMDYLIAQLKANGIYTKLSAHFGTPPLGVGDKKYVPFLEEFGSFSGRQKRVKVPHSGIYYSPELQNVQIAHYVNLLRHKNPYTGLTYAEDPAIAFIEILNEQSILFHSSMTPLKASPTIRKDVGKRFCAWLKKKYGSHEGLVAAWGEKALNSFGPEGFASSGEHLDAGTILPLGKPWFWDPDNLNTSQEFRRQRLLDSMVFLIGLQNDFNTRFVKAVRDAGYPGELIGSNWQAGRAFSHYLNLHSDALVGTIDRHNYFGGMGNTMLDRPGGGLLSSGMQQVSGRPFMLSEWIHVSPNEFGVEGPAILGAYGMGLQGWDVSYMFQNGDSGDFSKTVGSTWDVTVPQIFGAFPAIARQVLRGDVRQADVVAPRYVHAPSLGEGKLGFDDRVQQSGDIKEFAGVSVPADALAVARCVVTFTEDYRETPAFDIAPYVDGDTYRSSTGELRWTAGKSRQDGQFTIDTDGTQAVVGFAEGSVAKLKHATITSRSHFAAIYISAPKPNSRVDNAASLLVTTLARARNTGAKVVGDTLLAKGEAPILMEPVRAEIQLARAGTPTVWVLDHDGLRTGEKVPVKDGAFVLDGAKFKTPYYEVAFGK